MPAEVIVSPDTRRADRLPPGHARTHDWPEPPADHPVPPFDPASWDFSLFPVPLVDAVASLTWPQFLALPRVRVFADLHDASGTSRLDNLWEGVSTRELLTHVRLSPDAQFVMVHGEYGVCANLPLADFLSDDCLFALKHDGRDLAPDRGGPVRLVVPRMYSWKGVRWVRGVEFMAADRPGFFELPENGGRPAHGDPWATE